ncbi:LysR substrate-binding domain-containing protein [Thalassolituus sp. LLYu03]|uniref:LysR substrate-binding domain-containing protein n=1 Tax=Thalassolituus sp. LLYu03 TaxID=3421656 RepID=UPI003D2B99A8
MSLRHLDLNLLPVFAALMEEQHLTRAAERLFLSQPAVSNALKRLRLQLADDLFVRTATGLKPTPRAMQLYAKVRDGLELIEQGWAQQQSFDPVNGRQTFRISANGAVEFMAAPWLMRELRQRAPGIALMIETDQTDDIGPRLQDGRLDLAIDYIDQPQPGLNHQPLVTEPLVVIAARRHPQFSPELTFDAFRSLDHVSLLPRNRQGTPIEQLMGHKELKRSVKLWVSSFVAIPPVVANTDLIAVVPQRLAQQAPWADALQQAPLPFDCPPVALQLIWHQSRERDQAHLWLREQLLSLSQWPGTGN